MMPERDAHWRLSADTLMSQIQYGAGDSGRNNDTVLGASSCFVMPAKPQEIRPDPQLE